jgi:chromosome segregation ATPase
MNVVPIILALAAAGAAAGALYWCYRMNEQMARLGAGLLTQEEKHAVARATARHDGLETHLDEFSSKLEARLSGLESSVSRLEGRFEQFEQRVAQLENRSGQFESRFAQVDSDIAQLQSKAAEAEETCRNVGPIAQDLARLAKFKGQVEQIHSRVLQAFDGVLAQSNTPPADAPSPQEPPEETA